MLVIPLRLAIVEHNGDREEDIEPKLEDLEVWASHWFGILAPESRDEPTYHHIICLPSPLTKEASSDGFLADPLL